MLHRVRPARVPPDGGGAVWLINEANHALDGTGYSLVLRNPWTLGAPLFHIQGAAFALVAALQEVGAENLHYGTQPYL